MAEVNLTDFPAGDGDEDIEELVENLAPSDSATNGDINTVNIDAAAAKRTQIMFSYIAKGYEPIGSTSNGGALYFKKKRDPIYIGGTDNLPISTGLSIHLENRVATIQLAGTTRPIKQYVGGLKKNLTLSLIGPGSVDQSGVAGVFSQLQSYIENSGVNSINSRHNNLYIINELINAFDIQTVMPTKITGMKTDVSTSTISIDFENTTSGRRGVPLVHKTKDQFSFIYEVLRKLLEKGIRWEKEIGSFFAAGDSETRQTAQGTEYAVYHIYPIIDGTSPFKNIQAQLGELVVRGYKKKIFNKGKLTSLFFSKWPDIFQPQLEVALPADITNPQEKLQAYKLQLKQLQNSDLAQRNPAVLKQIEDKIKQQEEALKVTPSSLGTQLGNEFLTYMDLQLTNFLYSGDGTMELKLYKFLSNPNVLAEFFQHEEAQDLKDERPGFIIQGLPPYDHLVLPADSVYNLPGGYNPDFFFADQLEATQTWKDRIEQRSKVAEELAKKIENEMVRIKRHMYRERESTL